MQFTSARGLAVSRDLPRLGGGSPVAGGTWLLGLAVVYGALAWLVFAVQQSAAPAFFPAAGVTLAFMYLADRRLRVAGALVIVVVELGVDLAHGLGMTTGLLLAVANAAEPLLGAALLDRWFGRWRRIPAPTAVLRFAGAAAVATAASSMVGGSALSIATADGWWAVVAAWWFGDLLGVLVVTPVVVLIVARSGPQGGRWTELVVSTGVVAAWMAWLFFGTSLPLSWTLFPAVGWLAVRYGSLGATIASVVVAGMGFAAVASDEPFLASSIDRRQGPLLVHLMLVALVIGAHLLAAEVQDAKRSARVAVEGEASLRAVIDHAPVAIIEIDGEDSTVLSWNAAAEATFSVRAEHVVGRPLPVGIDLSDHTAHRDRAVADAGARRFSVVRRGRHGQELHLDVAVQPRTSIDGRVILTSIIHDRTADITAQAALRERIATDHLTGLASRTAVGEQLEEWIARSVAGRRSIAVFCDLDGFKSVNDSLGHHVGDVLLVEAAERLRRCVRPGDLVARLGGDEFVILAAMPHEEASAAFVERLREAFRTPFACSDGSVTIGISIGHTVIEPNMQPDEVLAAADRAMYDDKERHGRYRSVER